MEIQDVTYRWRAGKRMAGSAQDAGQELERIKADQGELKPAGIVAEAKPKGSVLHPYFEWSNPLAANLYREHQARQLVGSIVITKVNGEKTPRHVRAFVSMGEGVDRRYQSTLAVMQDPNGRAALLQQALNELHDFRNRYNDFQEFSQVFAAIPDDVPAAAE